MKFGWCTDIQNIALAEKLGFDYLEGIAAAVAAMDEGEFSQALSLVSGSAISPEAFCVMFGGGIKLTGDDARAGDIDEYCARLFSRLARLGGKTAVFGSGRARNVPDGFDHARAFDQLVRFCRIIASRAAENGLVVALEPLRPDECNIYQHLRRGRVARQCRRRSLLPPAARLLSHGAVRGQRRKRRSLCGYARPHPHRASYDPQESRSVRRRRI